ncbi:hypothetical protein D3C76_356150 [compost metagenome]
MFLYFYLLYLFKIYYRHDMLMTREARKVAVKRVLTLIRVYLNAGVMVDEKLDETTKRRRFRRDPLVN